MASSVDFAPLQSAPGAFVKSRLTYTSCYCEENIYCMIRDHVDPLDRKEFVVVFISNEEKCCPLFYQKAGAHPKVPVCWDYHVILIYKPAIKNSSSIVYDFDTTLDPFGLPFEVYFSKTLYGDETLWSELDPEVDQEAILSFVDRHPRFFRLVSAEEYLRLFASTRKHMMKELSIHTAGQENEGLGVKKVMEAEWWKDKWMAKPPDYPPIRTEESEDTLAQFLDFSRPNVYGYGKIVGECEFWQEFADTPGHRSDHASMEQTMDFHNVQHVG